MPWKEYPVRLQSAWKRVKGDEAKWRKIINEPEMLELREGEGGKGFSSQPRLVSEVLDEAGGSKRRKVQQREAVKEEEITEVGDETAEDEEDEEEQ